MNYIYLNDRDGNRLLQLPDAATLDIPDDIRQKVYYLYASSTQLTEVKDLPNLKTLYARSTQLTEVKDLPKLEYLDASSTQLTEVKDLPNLKTLYASSTPIYSDDWIKKYQEPGGRMERFLTAGGKNLDVVVREGWDCHEWTNCPTAVAFSVHSINGVPKDWRMEATLFITLFDNKLLTKPQVADREVTAAA